MIDFFERAPGPSQAQTNIIRGEQRHMSVLSLSLSLSLCLPCPLGALAHLFACCLAWEHATHVGLAGTVPTADNLGSKRTKLSLT